MDNLTNNRQIELNTSKKANNKKKYKVVKFKQK